MRLLDLFCCAGGAAEGYRRAGFNEIVGVDLHPQKRYPFEFIQGDALEFLRGVRKGDFDLIHASPPCQAHSIMRRGRWQDREHPQLIEPIREQLRTIRIPYVIENVPGSPLVHPIMLCGTMFGLQTREGSQLRRHRLFESNRFLSPPADCDHNDGSPIGVYGGGQHPSRRRPATIGVWGNAGGHSKRDNLDHYGVEARREAMGIDWMTQDELSQAIPPAFTEHIGNQIARQL